MISGLNLQHTVASGGHPERITLWAMWWILLAYLGALAGAVSDVVMFEAEGPLSQGAVAFFSSIVWLFGFSAFYKNSSVFDPFWSVAPPLLFGFWALMGEAGEPTRVALVLACTCIWALRLTLNWARGFGGLHHEDWRYLQLKQQTGRAYWAVSFFGIHLFPGALVWLGCLAGYEALRGSRPIGILDIVGTLICLVSTMVEAIADEQLRRHRQTSPGKNIDSGLWAWSRHPNYLGEIGFWTGLWCFAMAASVANAWTLVGPFSIAILFRFISIPLMEKRQIQKEGYAEYQRNVSMLLPWPRRS